MTFSTDASQTAWEIPHYLEVRNNHVHINSADAIALVKEFDTPLFVVSAPRIRHNIAKLAEVTRRHPRVKLCFASKANPLLGILRVVKAAGIDVEVNSGGELYRALRAGFRPDQIVFNGTSKTVQEIEEAVSAGIFSINLDSAYELEVVEQVAARLGKRARVTVRVVPDVGTRSHIGLQTALYTSKFGISPQQVQQVLRRALQYPELIDLAGVHIHVGSQTPDVEPFVDAFSVLWEHLVQLYRETGHRLSHINIGGGIPVNYLRDSGHADEISERERAMLSADLTGEEMIDSVLAAISASATVAGAGHLLKDLEIVMEPGRSIIADAGTILTSVRNIKTRPETGDVWLLTDAGYNLMLSMVMYQWYYHGVNASRAGEPHATRYKVAGPLCDGGDVYFDLHGTNHLPDYRLLPEGTQVGDVLAMLNTGAYTLSQMTTYNGRPMPAAVMIEENGQVEVIRRRDSYEDLLLNES